MGEFSAKDFNPEKYVSELASKCVGGSDLNIQKANLQSLSEETHSALKKNVYQHYGQFISTAHDISYLAGEMYQISQTLREQRTVIQNILDTSIIASRKVGLGDETPTTSEVDLKWNKAAEDDDNKKKMLSVLERVEGSSNIIERNNRNLVFEGDLLEIDPDSYSAVQRKRGFLFNDGIMLAVWVPNRRGPQRYRFEAFYELGSLGLVVNIRDPECPKHTFKLLIFPSVHLLQCPNQPEKDSWVNQIEGIQKILRNPSTEIKTLSFSPNSSPVKDFSSAFHSADSERAKSPEEISIPPWAFDIPEDLDVWIAQRNFPEAVELYETFTDLYETTPLTPTLKDIKNKVDARMKTLIDILISDLEIMTPEKILQGGPRAIRKSVDLLVKLGRGNQASQLFLAHRSAFIKYRLKRLKQEGRNQLYLDQMAVIFFSNILETMKEYKRSFTSETTSETSCLVVWVNSEVNGFINIYCKILFTPSAHLSSVSNSVVKVRLESEKLVEEGMDVSYSVDSLLLPNIERTIIDAKDKLVEAVKHRYRSQAEVGLPMKFNDKTARTRAFNEMAELGISNLDNYLRGDLYLSLSSNIISFSKSWLHFCTDVLQLIGAEWKLLIENAICEVITTELAALSETLTRIRKDKEKAKAVEILEKDALFLLEAVIPIVGHLYASSTKGNFQDLNAITDKFTHLRKRARTPTSSPFNSMNSPKSRFTSPEFV